jgi:hypothetical protein
MDLFKREAALRQQFENNQVQFLLTEVDTGITFCNVANSSDNAEKTRRNTAHAREAHDSALHFLPKAHFDAGAKTEFDAKMVQLKSLLRDLGEQV